MALGAFSERLPMWIAAVALLGCGELSGAPAAWAGDPSQPVRLDISAQPLESALRVLAKQADVQILFSPALVAGFKAPAVAGEMSVRDALALLLKATALEFEIQAPDIVVLKRAGRPIPEKPVAIPGVPSAALEEIVVTAQKREERLENVPVPVTAISGETLVSANQLRLQDYFSSIPGLSMTPGDFRGDPILTIRGITTGGSYITSTVGVVIDDIPYGSSTNESTGSESIDIDPSELARVEVLRGPQGTLYGASSIGGLIKYVTVDPSTEGLSGRVQAGTSYIDHGTQPGYYASAAVNIPLNDTLAVRLSGFSHLDPGYIDNILSGARGINKGEVDGGHLSALWRPSDSLSLKVGALLQQIQWDGSPYVQPSLGDLKQSLVPGTGAGTKKTQAYSAILKTQIGSVNLTSLSGYSINRISDSIDFSGIFGPVVQPHYGVAGASNFENLETRKFSEELRAVVSLGERLEWLAGGFYTHENTPWAEVTYASNATTGLILSPIYYDSIQSTYEEYAAFTDLTFRITDQWDIQLGGRESKNRQTYMEEISGSIVPFFFGTQPPLINPQEVTNDDSFTYLVTPRFMLSSDLMLYARFASGYRNGGPNTTAILFNLPPRFEPDKTKNYEIGAKGSAWDRALSFDASVYYIDWKDIQLQVNTPQGATYVSNASRAKSEGVELSVEMRPVQPLKLSAWIAWNEAVLTQPFPPGSPAYGVAGDRLPYSSRFSGNAAFEETFPLGARITGFFAGSLSYLGDRESVFTSSVLRERLPAYAKTDLRGGAKYETWTGSLFVTNLANRRGVLSGGYGAFLNYTPLAYTYIQPRTVGLYISKTF